MLVGITRTLLGLFAVVTVVTLTSCGGGASTSASSTGASVTASVSTNTGGAEGGGGGVVARVGGTPITKAAVNHWMGALAGGDYYDLSGRHTLPDGLVSEPPNYTRCVATLEAAAANSPKRVPGLTATKLLTKCRLMYQGLRAQATTFLVKVPWLTGAAGEQGITVTDAEVLQFFKRYKAQQFPNEAEFQQYLTSRKLSPADELLLLKLDLIDQKSNQKIAVGGKSAYDKLLASEQRWTGKTVCNPGYVVEHCRQFTGGRRFGPGPSPSVLMEQVAALATGRCTNLAACAKQ